MTMGLIPKPQDNWPTWAVILYYSLLTIIGVGFVVVTILKTFRYLKKGQAGIKTRRGVPRTKNYGEYLRVGPGIHPVIPFVDSIEDISVLDQVTSCPLVISEGKGKQYGLEVRVTWKVIDDPLDLHNAIFRAKSIEDIVTAEVMSAIAEGVEEVEKAGDRREIARIALARCSDTLKKYGIKIIRLSLVGGRTQVQVLVDGQSSDDETSPVADAATSPVTNAGLATLGLIRLEGG